MGNSTKKRIHQVAREFNISHDALISHLKKLNYDISSRMSLVTEEMYEEVAKRFGQKIEISDEKDFDFKRKLKEKRVRDKEKKIEAQRDYEEKVRTSIKIMSERPGVRKAKSVTVEAPPIDDIDIQEDVTEIGIPEIPAKKARHIKKSETEVEADVKLLEDAEKAVKELVSKEKQKEIAQKKESVDLKSTKSTIEEEEIEKREKEKEIADKISTAPVTSKVKDSKDIERELELKVIRKIEAEKGKKVGTNVVSEEAKKKKPKRKKLKAKERISEITVIEDDEASQLKKHKKKKWEDTEQKPEAEVKRTKFKKKAKKKKKIHVDEEEVKRSIKETLTLMDEGTKTRRHRKKVKADEEEVFEDDNVLKVHEFISVGELAQEMEIDASEVIKKCLQLGTLVSINQRLDEETIMTVADEFGFHAEIIPEFGTEKYEEIEDKDDAELAVHRSPVVTIMGHVDHGKTSLLDYIRKSKIADSESGSITQHIGAYNVDVRGKSITFLDTPGHEAFAAMRARGAQVTDIVILVVAADDNVMPQTIEAISHAKAAGVPIIVAINKIDKSNANPEAIKQQLTEYDVLIESWGGKYQSVEISAKTGQNVDKLLDSILVESEMLELKANPDRLARGVVIESKLDKGKGVLATVLIQKGSLHVGDPFISGQFSGKVRNLYNDRSVKTDQAGPATPVQVMGFSGLPQAGDTFVVLGTEKDTKDISYKRQQIKREQEFRRMKHLTLDEISRRIREGVVKELSVIIKGDVGGSVEAISDSLSKLSNNEVAVKIIHKGVGAISESDVLLASASNAIILGFQVRSTIKAREVANREKVDIRLYKVIYDAISNVRDALEGLLEPEFEEKNLSVTEIREIFRVPKVGQVAGCYIVSGKVNRNDRAKLYRDDKLVFDGKISTLKRFKDDVREVMSGFECGISLAGYDDFKIGDIIETYQLTEIKRTLVPAKQ